MEIQCNVCNKSYDAYIDKLPVFTLRRVGRTWGLVCENCIDAELGKEKKELEELDANKLKNKGCSRGKRTSKGS